MEWAPLVPELLVSDYQNSMEFYAETLDFSIKFTREDPRFAYLTADNAQLMIQEEHEDEHWKTDEMRYPYGRGMNLQIEVSSIDSYISRLKSEDYPLFEDVQENWYRTDTAEHGNREFLVQDPDGYLLRFVEYIGTR